MRYCAQLKTTHAPDQLDPTLDFGECGGCNLPLPITTKTVTENGLRCADCRHAAREQQEGEAARLALVAEALQERSRILSRLAYLEHWLAKVQATRLPFQPSP